MSARDLFRVAERHDRGDVETVEAPRVSVDLAAAVRALVAADVAGSYRNDRSRDEVEVPA
jgi:hypothetical protein